MRLVLLTIAVISIVAFAVVDGGAEFIKRAARRRRFWT